MGEEAKRRAFAGNRAKFWYIRADTGARLGLIDL